MRAGIRLLGPVEVSGPHGLVPWSGARRRSVFALLALSPGRLVPGSRLIDGLWGDEVPATALKTLQSHVAQLRKGLSAAGLDGLLVTRDPGYLILVDSALVDAHRFEEHARVGRRALDHGDVRAAVERFEAGLALWRGDPLADCPVTGWAGAEITRLSETRALVEEQRITALCLLGRHAEAIGELERLVARYPLREKLWELLMAAQHRSGRPADALRTYRRVRVMLVDEVGLEPGAGLRKLEAAVLAGEPEADLEQELLPARKR
ncbi:AfsR/SARP family transcriptional regulator [Actinosynnema sp. CS-041913]|uniref:AfsR/SARP family transcriptional regulator n=1 Tax=Actinosynnema sp. CS-041913 TaxID=3239917 RepID=UPI003D94F09B